jgi:hypothetical protein
MAQFYNEEIYEKIKNVLNFMSKKDIDLNSQRGKKIGKINFEKEFYEIYNFEIPNLEPIIKKLFIFNSQDFENVDNFKNTINDFDISLENTHLLNVEFNQKITELCNNSYAKYLSLANLYDIELNKKLKK